MPYSGAVSSSLWVSCCNSSALLRADRCYRQTAMQSGRPPMDTDDSGMSVPSASPTASSAKQSFSDAFTGVRGFCLIFSGNTLEIMTILVVLLLSFERKLQHFRLVAHHLLVHRTATWWLRSACCQCCILLRIARGLRAGHDRTLYWSRWNYDRAPSCDVARAFPPTTSSWISAPWCSSAKHPPVAFVFKGLNSPFQISHQRPALTFIDEHRQDKWPIHRV